ncbi:MAG: valine--tRNA ligase [Calothrix sp. C42_A2020_038]|nr:valine--tRNA ligase [Calothrix sp. C42_A2020_038]
MTATTPSNNLPSVYDPKAAESKWQQFWEENHIYKADPSNKGEPYCIVIPPPNVTGSLHMGHAFDNSLIDTLVRYHRMKGKNALYLPGTDHASIAVQTILEKQLKEEGKTRYDLGREKFLERAWQWKAESGGTIVNQLRRLGVSVDWTRERFTLDEGLSKAVLEAFVKLYDEGLIYRGEYLVNWCPESQSAVSDLEVDQKEVNGNLWHFRYPLCDHSGYVEVATTRPETMLGDTAVAVNPNDERYKNLIGKTLILPIMNREIPIIGDELVDPTFGTGCVKVTPAHDPNDFQMGKRHNLPFINIMNKNGALNENAGEFQGQDRFVARKNVVAKLEELGVLVKVEEYKHTVPYSERGKVPIEPLLSTQWFVKIRPLADKALEFLDQQNSPHFVPQRWSKVYRDWLVKLEDWCISRQLWWGHQIPAWYAVSETGGEISDTTPFVVARNAEEALKKAKVQFGEEVKLERDPDVLDTWFSSGLWPFSTMGWPQQTPDLAKYYPTSVLVTGFDIIFFWVARMTMMAGHFTGKMPFQDVYIHGLVLDEKGKKMSKSAGNGIDPLLLIDKYGTDALRYTLIKEVAGAGQDIRLDYDRKKNESQSFEASRNFANKLWNASRFVMMNLPHPLTPSFYEGEGGLELSDKWILSRYNKVVKDTNNYISNYGLGEAAKGLYEFIWGDFCDWYIELVKSRLQKDADAVSQKVAQQTLVYVLEGILKLLHPYMPHITEEIWHTLTQQGADSKQSLSLQHYPEADETQINLGLEEEFDLLIGTIRTIRNLRAEADVKPGMKVAISLQTDSSREREILSSGEAYIKDLAKVESLSIVAGEANSEDKKAIAGVIGTVQVILPLTGVVDIAAFCTKLQKKLEKIENDIKSLSARLNNPGFVNNASPDIVQSVRDNLAEAEAQAQILRDRIHKLKV